MSLKSFTSLRQVAFHLKRDYKRQLFHIAYGLPFAAKYKEFEIPRKSGGVRRICAPKISLLMLQRDFLKLIEPDYQPRANVHGFVSGRKRSIVSNAHQHVGRRWVLNVDLKDYFETIHFGRIKGRLMAPPYRYSEEIAQFVAHIACIPTRKVVEGHGRETNVLVAGGALAPILSNIVSDRLDGELARYCRKLGCTYSRYADDITISSNRKTFPSKIGRLSDPDDYQAFELATALEKIIKENGFTVNPTKTRLLGRGVQQEVTGLVVNERVNVRRRFVRDVRAMLYDWETNGLDAASDKHFSHKRPDRGRLCEAHDFQWVVRGKIEFIKQVKGASDRVFRKLAERFNGLSSDISEFEIPLVEDEEVLKAAVWFLDNETDGGSVGTCFAISDSQFITCAHCIGPNLQIYSRKNPKLPMAATVLKRDGHNDLALIGLEEPLAGLAPAATLKIADDTLLASVDLKSPVQTAGYPSNSDTNTVTLRSTEVIGFSRKTFDGKPAKFDNVLELLSGTFQGMSGGPVLYEGKVVGVIVGGPNEEDRTAPFLAVNASALKSL